MDSVLLMLIYRELEKDEGVSKAGLVTATKENLDLLRDAGFSPPLSVKPTSILVAIEADTDEHAEAAIKHGLELMDKETTMETGAETITIGSLGDRIGEGDFPVLFISTPGEYVEELANKGLDQGLHVHIFSSNVPRKVEIALKKKGKKNGLLVMGPDAGTVIIQGAGLGFANQVRKGDVAVIGSSGSGMQEATVLLDRGGLGVSYAIGVGSKDMTKDVDGMMTKMAIEMFKDSKAFVIIGKTPDPKVEEEIIAMLKGRTATFIGLGETEDRLDGGVLATGSIDRGVNHILKAMGRPEMREEVPKGKADLEGRKLLRALFVGGSLCYQAQAVIGDAGIKVYSNAPASEEFALPEDYGNLNVCIDTGAEEYVKGRPHPMIDPVARNSWLVKESKRSDVAVLLFEIMLGWGSALDPLEGLEGLQKGPLAIASICGTKEDKQDYGEMEQRLKSMGVVVFNSSGTAAEYAASVMGDIT
jgi:FdrA protein